LVNNYKKNEMELSARRDEITRLEKKVRDVENEL
jgi:polyhydroxyalkanoate synthesis regulator phasin